MNTEGNGMAEAHVRLVYIIYIYANGVSNRWLLLPYATISQCHMLLACRSFRLFASTHKQTHTDTQIYTAAAARVCGMRRRGGRVENV